MKLAKTMNQTCLLCRIQRGEPKQETKVLITEVENCFTAQAHVTALIQKVKSAGVLGSQESMLLSPTADNLRGRLRLAEDLGLLREVEVPFGAGVLQPWAHPSCDLQGWQLVFQVELGRTWQIIRTRVIAHNLVFCGRLQGIQHQVCNESGGVSHGNVFTMTSYGYPRAMEVATLLVFCMFWDQLCFPRILGSQCGRCVGVGPQGKDMVTCFLNLFLIPVSLAITNGRAMGDHWPSTSQSRQYTCEI